MITKKIFKINSVLVLQIVSFLVILIFQPNKFELINHDFNRIVTIICLINVCVFLAFAKEYYKTWIRFDVLFLLAFAIVHFQIPFLASLGIEPERPHFIWINELVVNYATWLSALSLLLWLIGFNLFIAKWTFSRLNLKDDLNLNTKSIIIQTNKIDIILILLFVIFIGVVGKSFLTGSYAGTSNWGTGAVYIFLPLRILLFLRIVYFFNNYKKTKISIRNILYILSLNKALFVVIIVYCILFLLSGDRGTVLQLALVIVGAYTLYQKPIKLKYLFLMILIGAVSFTIIKYGRTRDASLRESNILVEGYNNLISSNDSFNPTNELATSVRILYTALDVVPEKHPYLYGSTIANDILGVFPFGASIFIELADLPRMYISSSLFFTITGQGSFYSYGEGSEVIADLYINLGIIGVFIIMFNFGYLASFLTLQANYRRSHSIIIAYLILLTFSISINRSQFLLPLKTIIWALVIDKYIVRRYHTIHE